jgi:GntR family transcriptional regulator
MAGQGDVERVNRKIADDIRTQIEDGTLTPGSEAPGENEIIKQYDVSRTTARAALAILKAEGLIEARQGVRGRIRAFQPIRRNATQRLAHTVWGEGKAIWDVDVPARTRAVDVVVSEVTDVPERILRVFGATTGTSFCRRSRRYVVDDKPVMLAESHLLTDMVAGSPITQSDTGEGGTYARLADLGFAPAHFREEIRVRMPNPVETKQLGLATGAPVICIARTAATADGTVVEINEMTLDANSYLLEYDFSA